MRAVLRRRKPDAGREGLAHGDAAPRSCAPPLLRRGPAEIELTAKEFDLLRTSDGAPRARADPRDQLLDEVWGADIAVTTRTIDTHLKRLREKLGAASDLIETVRGVGYRFAE